MRFIVMKDVLLPLIQVIPVEVVNTQALQSISDILKGHKTWTVAHVAAHMGYCQAFAHPAINR